MLLGGALGALDDVDERLADDQRARAHLRSGLRALVVEADRGGGLYGEVLFGHVPSCASEWVALTLAVGSARVRAERRGRLVKPTRSRPRWGA